MNFKLLAAIVAASAAAILSGFGDAVALLPNSGNMDALLLPVFGQWGWYLMDLTVPFVSLGAILLVAKYAYEEGLKH